MKKNILPVAVALLLLSSCKKDQNDNCPVSTTSLAGTYKLVSLKYKASESAAEENWYEQVVEACKKDDLYTLNANGVFSIEDAGTVCPQNGSYTGTWTLNGNFINMDGFYFGEIDSYNCTVLVFSQTDALTTGDNLTATFTKQ